jgi:hypothetical protein
MGYLPFFLQGAFQAEKLAKWRQFAVFFHGIVLEIDDIVAFCLTVLVEQ